ncbi:MAG: hypothetical protein WD904_01980 [Dehalococcoidia bacterium]
MFSDFSIRVGLPASFAGVAIGILFAVCEVQGWKMPAPIAVGFIVILLVMIAVALGIIGYELFREAQRYFERRATSASWVSSEEPGLLDYEADGLRAIHRFTREMDGLAKNTRKLGRSLTKHTERFEEPNLQRNARLKQKRANQAAKSIDRAAVYIEKRAELFQKLVKDISRNYAGLIANITIATEEDRASGTVLAESLAANSETVTTTIGQVTGYRDSVRSVQERNLSRTVRIAGKRLADALDSAAKILKSYKQKSRELHQQLTQKMESAKPTPRSTPDKEASPLRPTS